MPISKGGTGNNAGYIRTGRKANTSIGNQATAEGSSVTASGHCSHAEGFNTTASGQGSHAGGYGTIAAYSSQTAIGKYNDNKSYTLFEVGNGTDDNNRSNAFEVRNNGDVNVKGTLRISDDPLFRTRLFRIKAHGSVTLSAREHFAAIEFLTNTAWDTWFLKYKPIIFIGTGEAYTSSTYATEIMVLPKQIYKKSSGGIGVKCELYNTSDVSYTIVNVYIYVLAAVCDTLTDTYQDIT